jgi:LAO/AO transport system kinase
MHATGLVEGIQQRSIPSLARAISLVENGRNGYEELLSALHPMVGRAHRIGITGPPGAGKSTLIERLVQAYRAADLTVAVVLDAFGFERIIIETVGVGQSELAIAGSADTTALMLVPESGDGVQVLKAGVMEIADLYLVNKADRPGADRLVQEVDIMLGIRRGSAFRHVGQHHRPSDISTAEVGKGERGTGQEPVGDGEWEPPVLTAVAVKGVGVERLIEVFGEHYAHLERTGQLAVLRRERLARHTREVVDRALSSLIWHQGDGDAQLAEGLDDVVQGRISPYKLAHEIVGRLQEDSRR